jgi:hypothetical protein
MSELFGILSMTTMHNWQSVKPPSLLLNHHPEVRSSAKRGSLWTLKLGQARL